MQPHDFNNHSLWAVLVGVAVAACGGLARFLSKDTTHSIGVALASMFISAFAGAIVGLICMSQDLNIYYTFALAGLAGWSGEPLLNAMSRLTNRLTGTDRGK